MGSFSFQAPLLYAYAVIIESQARKL